MKGSPGRPPIGLQLARTAHVVTQAFERSMAEAGGSAATWQVLLLVRTKKGGTPQARMATELGITGATLTHHLNALEAKGYVRRWREAGNRRIQHTALTPVGEKLFERLRRVAMQHDARLRSELSEKDAALLGDLLDKLRAGLDD